MTGRLIVDASETRQLGDRAHRCLTATAERHPAMWVEDQLRNARPEHDYVFFEAKKRINKRP